MKFIGEKVKANPVTENELKMFYNENRDLFGIRSIPVQVFFDENGTEVFRHSGFFPETELEKKLTQFPLP